VESLGGWEHEVRRRHDTLLRQYLVARGLPSALERTLRDAFWLASVSNSLSGALCFHLVGNTCRGRSRELAAGGPLTRKIAQQRADHASMCDDNDEPAGVAERDTSDGAKHAARKRGVADWSTAPQLVQGG
jgi:hypothetical protein